MERASYRTESVSQQTITSGTRSTHMAYSTEQRNLLR